MAIKSIKVPMILQDWKEVYLVDKQCN